MNIKQYLLIGISLLGFVSCSETDETSEEFADWKNKNETYFLQHYQEYLQEYLSKGEASDKVVIPCWSMPSNMKIEDLEPTDCILAYKYVKSEVAWTDNTPEFTDSVAVHYRGSLIPSPHYPEGYVFDRSYMSEDKFDPDVDVPARFSVSGNIISGFSTALQHMHRGEGWIVIIPYQLGYGTTETSSLIPAYSTLVFEIFLQDFWMKERGDRY
jgi:FKBP-type peptidyl-prolyl cis-trans isomerase FklB